MENATKALLIAAGMLLSVMLISLLVMGYNQISSYYEQQHELLTAEQLDKFNKQFQNYNRSGIRGNELISLMNKVIDYNVSQSYQEGTEYEPIRVTITIGDNLIEEFRYEQDDTAVDNIVEATITNTNGGGPSYANDRKLVDITGTPANLITKAASAELNNLTDVHLQKLTTEISNIMFDENESSMDEVQKYRLSENRRNRGIILKNILKVKVITNETPVADAVGYYLKLDKDNYYRAIDGQDKIDTIKEIVSQYYQYTQFKRACFRCTELKHNANTGRVNEMNFAVETKNGKVVFD